jgi:hypothetical protein
LNDRGSHFLNIEGIGEAGKALAYVRATETLLYANRNAGFPFIKDLGVEVGPLNLLCGHAIEISCKALLQLIGISSKKLKNHKGHITKIGDRKSQVKFRRHDLVFLFRAATLICMNKQQRVGFQEHISRHTYFNELHCPTLDPSPPRPNLHDFLEHLELLNSAFDAPYRARYFETHVAAQPHTELLVVGARFMAELAQSKARTAYRGRQ